VNKLQSISKRLKTLKIRLKILTRSLKQNLIENILDYGYLPRRYQSKFNSCYDLLQQKIPVSCPKTPKFGITKMGKSDPRLI
jgi:hypothetical protein